MSVPDQAVEAICKGAPEISQYLNNFLVSPKFSAIVKVWILDNLRLLLNHQIIAGKGHAQQ